MTEPGDRQAQPPLTQLTFYLADSCNLTCHQCWTPALIVKKGNGYNGNGNGNNKYQARPFLPAETFSRIVREALPLGLRAVNLSGSDPLLHPEFDRLLDLIERFELAVTIETGGAGMSPGRADRISSLPQCSVSIGLDGANAATHDGLRGMPGSFQTATRAARLLAENEHAPQIIFSLLRRNAGQIPAMVRLAESLGAESLRFVVALPNLISLPLADGGIIPVLPAPKHESLSVEELIAVGRKVEREFSRGTRLRLFFDQPPAFRGLHPMSHVEGQGRCSVLNSLSVLPDGSYALCGIASAFAQAAPQLTFGQAVEVALAKIWHDHPVLQTLRRGMPDRLEGVCDRCVMKRACLGNCVAENFLRTGTFWGPYWFCEAAERAGLFPMGRLIENRL